MAIGCVVADVDPLGSPAGRARFAAALVLLAAGSALHFWSKGCLEQNQRLVTAGPYRFTRNPFYLANGLIDLGLCALIGRAWVAGPYLVLWWLAYHDTIRREEARLAELFPSACARYFAAVPRLIPTGRSLPASEAEGRFTLANPALAEGSEYARIVGVWVAAATIGAWAWIRAHGLAVFAPEQTAGLGLVLLVAVAWVAKIALAEVFRSPRTALLPFSDEPSARRLVTAALVVGLYLVARFVEATPRSAAATGALIAMFVPVALLPRAKTNPRLRSLLHAALALAIGAFGAARGVLWIASVPLLWVVLAGLDDLGARRSEVVGADGESKSEARTLWPLFGRIAVGAVAGLALLAVLRRVG